ncbi:MAG: phenylalanine--tRNA ligase subunit beta, partial [Methanothrix sp.]|nr:phenylalanine--tRNA ligase subunit beta [Methanothrix sp.]
VVTSLAERGGRIESVLVRGSDGERLSPDLRPSRWTVDPGEANRLIGFDLTAGQLAECLERMRFGARAEVSSVEVLVPAYRADIMHSWDIFEDAAKGYGYDRLQPEMPMTVTVGRPHPSEVAKAEIRDILTGLGYLETMPFTLTNERAHFDWMMRPRRGAVRVRHPISELHTILRTSLLSSLLEIFAINQHHPLPQRIFAVGDVVYISDEGERRTGMNLAAASIHSGAGFAEARSLADAIMREMEIEAEIRPSQDSALLPGRGADLLMGGRRIGLLGEVHPLVLRNFGLEQPAICLELEWGQFQG